jgi:NADPH-dependent curcumin reductase CurA
LRVYEDVREGLESAPAALKSLFDGTNTGKLLVKIADP